MNKVITLHYRWLFEFKNFFLSNFWAQNFANNATGTPPGTVNEQLEMANYCNKTLITEHSLFPDFFGRAVEKVIEEVRENSIQIKNLDC